MLGLKKDVIILTKSDKNGGYCVAGIDINSKELIRLVSEDEKTDFALSLEDITYKNKSIMHPLDKITVELKGKQNSINQPENYIIDNTKSFQKIGECDKGIIENYIMNKPYIFYNSRNCVTNGELEKISNKYSLILFKVNKINLWKDNYKENRITASFIYNQQEYKYIKITDYELTKRYYNIVCEQGKRPYIINNPLLIMSLTGRPFKDKGYFKLIANII